MKRTVLQNILLNETTIEQCVSIIGKKSGEREIGEGMLVLE